jgi:hypothetical protein
MAKLLIGAIAATLLAIGPATAEPKAVTCTGTLIDVQISPKALWPLAVIYDASGNYTCTIDRGSAEHDPMRPCNVGEKCRVVGTYRMIGATYSVKTIDAVSR